MNHPNMYESPKPDLTALSAECEARSRALRAAHFSWFAMLAAVLLAYCTRAIHHERHGTEDPEELLALLSVLAIAIAFGFAIIAVIRVCRCWTVRTALYVMFPLLVSGGVFALLVCVAYCHR